MYICMTRCRRTWLGEAAMVERSGVAEKRGELWRKVCLLNGDGDLAVSVTHVGGLTWFWCGTVLVLPRRTHT